MTLQIRPPETLGLRETGFGWVNIRSVPGCVWRVLFGGLSWGLTCYAYSDWEAESSQSEQTAAPTTSRYYS